MGKQRGNKTTQSQMAAKHTTRQDAIEIRKAGENHLRTDQ